MSNKIATVVVTYNRKKLLEKCISNILNQTVKELDVLVIDNASTDGTQDMIKEVFSDKEQVKYYNTGANLGGAGGFSYGIRTAVEEGYEFVWIMDDDTIPSETALEELLNADKILQGNYGFLSSFAAWTDGTACKMNIPTIDMEQWKNDIVNQFDNQMIRVQSATFVSMFFKAEVIKEMGLPIKEFFIWSDDTEYSRRISNKYPSYFVYKSKVVHEMASNRTVTIVDEEDESRLDRYAKLYRNRYYILRHGPKREKLFFWMDVKNVVRSILKSGRKDKWKRVRIVLKSALSGKRFNPKVEYVKKGI